MSRTLPGKGFRGRTPLYHYGGGKRAKTKGCRGALHECLKHLPPSALLWIIRVKHLEPPGLARPHQLKGSRRQALSETNRSAARCAKSGQQRAFWARSIGNSVQRVCNRAGVPSFQVVEKMAGTTGLEPATSAVTVLPINLQAMRGNWRNLHHCKSLAEICASRFCNQLHRICAT
jgi:hypothetical protein